MTSFKKTDTNDTQPADTKADDTTGSDMPAKKRLFCFGFGYTAQKLAQRLIPLGFEVAGTTRDYDRRDALREQGFEAYVFDRTHRVNGFRKIMKDVTHILVSTPPDSSGDPVVDVHGIDLTELENLTWLGYLSATSVYGNHDGGWVSEETEKNPTSIRGSRRALAENQWADAWYRDAIPLHIFRLAGIYGLGRSAIETAQAGYARRIEKEGQAFSRIHVEDIVTTLVASMNAPKPGEIYNLADDAPAPSHEIIAYACEVLGIDVPPLIPWSDANLSPMAASFYRENKKVSNEKIKSDLGVKLAYPTYREGLDAIAKTYAESNATSDTESDS